MTRGRRAHADSPVNVMVSIPQSLNAKIELALYDPVLQKPKYGGRSALIQTLLREWLEKQIVLTSQGEADRINLQSEKPSGAP